MEFHECLEQQEGGGRMLSQSWERSVWPPPHQPQREVPQSLVTETVQSEGEESSHWPYHATVGQPYDCKVTETHDRDLNQQSFPSQKIFCRQRSKTSGWACVERAWFHKDTYSAYWNCHHHHRCCCPSAWNELGSTRIRNLLVGTATTNIVVVALEALLFIAMNEMGLSLLVFVLAVLERTSIFSARTVLTRNCLTLKSLALVLSME